MGQWGTVLDLSSTKKQENIDVDRRLASCENLLQSKITSLAAILVSRQLGGDLTMCRRECGGADWTMAN